MTKHKTRPGRDCERIGKTNFIIRDKKQEKKRKIKVKMPIMKRKNQHRELKI